MLETDKNAFLLLLMMFNVKVFYGIGLPQRYRRRGKAAQAAAAPFFLKHSNSAVLILASQLPLSNPPGEASY
jgi:hypothetical protein